jgi:hypothetical protein
MKSVEPSFIGRNGRLAFSSYRQTFDKIRSLACKHSELAIICSRNET